MDEPALKAKFSVSLGRLDNMTSIANMPAVEEGVAIEGHDGYVWDRQVHVRIWGSFLRQYRKES